MRRLVVVGAGISGLAAAHGALDAAREAGESLEVVVFERDPEIGGKARSFREDGYLVEGGPGGYLDSEPVMERLVSIAGLTGERIRADEAAADRYIVRGGVMRKVEPNPLRFARSGLLGPAAMMRLAVEPLVRKRTDSSDESVWDFAARRIGKQAADRLIAPMVLGVFAGDAKRLSLPSAFPRLAELESVHGSLVRGMIAGARQRRGGGPTGPAGTLTSFREGIQTLPRKLAEVPGIRALSDRSVEQVERDPAGGWRLRVRGESDPIQADAVVLAGEPWATAALVREHSARAATLLESVECPPVAVVALGFGAGPLTRVPQGFGVLIPRGEGYRILGCLWETHIFAGRSASGRLLVRAMLGGAVDPDVGSLDAEGLEAIVREDLRRLLGIHESPSFRRVVQWDRAIPQYTLGHGERVAQIEELLAPLSGLAVTGNGLHGVAFAKAAASAWDTGTDIVRRLLAS